MVNNAQRQAERVISNFTGVTRHDTMEGRSFLVAPMIMMVEGVHEGSNGPLYYPAEELAKVPGVWNTKPVVVYHPEHGGQGISACSPEVLTNRKIGIIMNTVFEDGKLKAEAWLDVDRMKIVDDRIAEAIENNQMMELSTGLFTENDGISGVWNKKDYDSTARNYRPDHLALLPDLQGACSIEDGAGFLRLNKSQKGFVIDVTTLANKTRKYMVKDNNGVLRRVNNIIASFIENEMSHSNVYTLLNSLLQMENDDLWIDEVFDTFFIYNDNGKLYQQGYQISNSGVSIVGNRIEVVRVVEFRTINGTFVGNERSTQMDKKKLVEALIKNEGTQWTEDDKEALMAMNEDTLKKMSPVVNEEDDDDDDTGDDEGAVANEDEAGKKKVAKDKAVKDEETETTENMTTEQYIDQAPPAMQGVLRNGLNSYNETKGRLIKILIANKQNSFTKAQLEAKDLDELQALAKLAANTEEKKAELKKAADYSGQGDPVENTTKEEPLELPTLNFEKEKEKQSA